MKFLGIDLEITALKLKNAAGTFVNTFTNATTAARTWTLPDKTGTIALISDLTEFSDREITQSSHGFTFGTALYFDGSVFVKAKADAANTLGLFLVSEVIDSNTFKIKSSGYLAGFSSLVAGNYYYVSAVTAGALDIAEPTSLTHYSNPILFALSSTEGYVLQLRPSKVSPNTALLDLSTQVTGVLAKSNGGTGITSLTPVIQEDYYKETALKQAGGLISTSVTAVPTTTGGVEVFSRTFTPKSDTSKLQFEFSLAVSNLVSAGQASHFLVMLFKNSETTAIAARAFYPTSVLNNNTVAGKFEIASTGKDTPVTFKFRIGSNQVNNVAINNTTSNYGGVANFSELWIREIER